MDEQKSKTAPQSAETLKNSSSPKKPKGAKTKATTKVATKATIIKPKSRPKTLTPNTTNAAPAALAAPTPAPAASATGNGTTTQIQPMTGEVKSLCFACQITTKGGKKLCYTTKDTELVYNSTPAISCLDFKQIRTSLLTQDQTEVELILFGQETEENLKGATADVILVGDDSAPGELVLLSGFVEKQTIINGTTTITLVPLYQRLQRSIGEFFSEFCRAELGDKRCGIDLSKHNHRGSITAVINRRTIKGNQPTPDGRFFVNGIIEFDAPTPAPTPMPTPAPTPAPNASNAPSTPNHPTPFRTRIINQNGDELHLLAPLPYEAKVGDTFTATGGCDKFFKTCRDKFHNIINFRGEPFLNGETLKAVTKPVSSGGGGGKK